MATAISLDSREAVAVAVAAGTATGGSETSPASDYGLIHQWQLTDPDGNIFEFGWMDPVAVEQGPGAFANQQVRGRWPHATTGNTQVCEVCQVSRNALNFDQPSCSWIRP